jgi:DNA-binding LytR/AlgR family response regulator
VDKAIENLNSLEKKVMINDANEGNYLFIKADGKIYKIEYDELLYAEAQGNYTKIVTERRLITPALTFTNLEKMLPATHFTRVHRSFIINRSKIDHIEGNRLFINKSEISIGSNYRESFLKSIGL